MTAEFQLDARLKADTHQLAAWPLCEVLMMNDAHYPWFILVPRVAAVTELYQLSQSERQQLDRESVYLGQTLMQLFQGDKLNIAALGNVVAQLHIHHIVRFQNDPAWPSPVWGKHPAQSIDDATMTARMQLLQASLEPDWSSMA